MTPIESALEARDRIRRAALNGSTPNTNGHQPMTPHEADPVSFAFVQRHITLPLLSLGRLNGPR
jgi:hypothetical protein